MEEETPVKCPYCNSKDLSVVPASDPDSQTITYKCQMCGRTFTKTAIKPE